MNYLITGGTGFIGRFVIRELLQQPDAVIYAIVRAGSESKLDNIRKKLGATSQQLIAVQGDITQPDLGITDTDRQRLKDNVDHLFHLAAIYDLNAPAEPQIKTNVEGTRHALQAAASLNVGCFHHTSSIAVAGMYPGTFTEDMFEEAANLNDPYFVTKHLAEKCVREEAQIPYRIYRPSMVVGDSETGEMDKADGLYYIFQLLDIASRFMPGNMPLIGLEGGQFNIVPVDYVAKSMVHIAHLPGYDGQCFHLTDSQHYSLGKLLTMAADQSRELPRFIGHIPSGVTSALPDKTIPAIAGMRWVQNMLSRWHIAPAALGYVTNPSRFDRAHTATALTGSDIAPPPLDSYLPLIWNYWREHLAPETAIPPSTEKPGPSKKDEVLFRKPTVMPYAQRAKDHWRWNFKSVFRKKKALKDRVNGKVIVLTGASSGIGANVAHKLANAGATVLLIARSRDKLEAIAEAIRSQDGKVFVYPADLSDGDDCDRVCADILAAHGGVDILINNAGRSIRRSLKFSFDRFHDYERTMKLNYFGSIRMAMNLMPGMLERGDGHVINVSTVGVQANPARFSAYLGSKWALEGWSWVAANELAHTGVTVSTINYPLVRTPMIAPTRIYKYTPAMSPEKAVDWMLDMIITRNKRKIGPMGLGALSMYYLLPKTSESIVNVMYQSVYEAPPADRPAGKKSRRITRAQRSTKKQQESEVI